MTQVKVRDGLIPVAEAMNTVLELHNKALRRGLFQDVRENLIHMDALGMLEEYIKATITDSGPTELTPVPMAEEVEMGGEA